MIIPIVPSRVEKKTQDPPYIPPGFWRYWIRKKGWLAFCRKELYSWICMDLHPTGCCFFLQYNVQWKTIDGIALRRSLVQGKTTPFFPKKKMDVSTIQVQEHGGKINQTWPSQQKKHGKSTIWLMFSHFGQLKLEFLDISWGNPMIITMSSSSHRRGWRETRRSCSEKNMWTEPSW